MLNKIYILFLFIVLHQACMAGAIKAGTGKVNITPALPFYLTGYAVRTTPATTRVHDLWAKALVLEENKSSRIVIVTTDVLGLTPAITETVASRAQSKYGITRAQIVFNSSHTHSGPMIWPALSIIGDYDAATIKAFTEYANDLTNKLMQAIDTAMQQLQPVTLHYGNGTAGFAFNRRQFTATGVKNGVNHNGPVDRDVPVLVAKNEQGKVKAIVFGYACHNTTVTGNHNSINGDYAGFAQVELEKQYPEATALFVLGCAGDQNPIPRGTLELAEKHGKELAQAVQTVLKGKTQTVGAPLRSAYTTTTLDLEPVNRAQMEKDLVDSNQFLQRRARLIMEADNRGWNITTHRYPVQAVRIGNQFTILALSGETVVDYSLKTKKAFPKEHLFVAGYCNQVVCYIPTKRILDEGGYEAEQNMIYYGMPGPFQNNVEEKVLAAIDTVMQQVGVVSSEAAQQAERRQQLKNTYGTYSAPPRKANTRVDIPKLLAQLKEIKANTYHWLIWQNENDWNDLKLFLPEARKNNLRVWVTVVPPSESKPIARFSSEPFGMDYQRWAAEMATLSLKEPSLVAWSIDDFAHNLKRFTPAYTDSCVQKARSINPRLAFAPCVYYKQITPGFANNYGHLLDGILFPYRAESAGANLQDPSLVQPEIAAIRKLFQPGFPVLIDIYATAHSRLGPSTPEYVQEVLRLGKQFADGVLIYCHQDPATAPEKYNYIKEGFSTR